MRILKSLEDKVSEQLKSGLLPTIKAFWDKTSKKKMKTGSYCATTSRRTPPHLDVDGFIGVRVGERGRGVDERHDAQAVVHKRDIGNDNVHDDLRGG